MHAEIQFGSRVHMLPLPKNHILKCRKKLAKNLHVHIHNICSFVKFHEKPIFFVVYVKKRKLILWKALFLVLCFIFLHTSHDKSQLFKGVAREDVHANFLFHFFEIQNMCKMHFKMEGAYAPMFQNTSPACAWHYYTVTSSHNHNQNQFPCTNILDFIGGRL
jgi:hypothetical protein